MYPANPRANNYSGDLLVLGAPRSDAALRRALDRFVLEADRRALLQGDPVELVHRYPDPDDQEVVGLLVAMLAYGRVASIRAKAEDALALLGAHPARAVDRGRVGGLDGFVHRFQAGDDLVRFLRGVGALRRRHGALALAFAQAAAKDDGPDYAEAMGRFVDALAEAIPGPKSYGLRFLLPNTAGGGAAKRLCLFLRWMIRPADGLDLGAWRSIAPELIPARLVIPLDTHVARIGRYLGLTDRRSQDLLAARDITASLRRLRPNDPLYYDMALCHLGISGRCPRQRTPVHCADCAIREVCRLGEEPASWPFLP